MAIDTRASARAFVRSLNILLKFARLYEFGHVRTAAQFETTWKELRAGLDDSGGSGELGGGSGTQILLGGVPLGSAAVHPGLVPGGVFRGDRPPAFGPAFLRDPLGRVVAW